MCGNLPFIIIGENIASLQLKHMTAIMDMINKMSYQDVTEFVGRETADDIMAVAVMYRLQSIKTQ
jgi:hypothetical protein